MVMIQNFGFLQWSNFSQIFRSSEYYVEIASGYLRGAAEILVKKNEHLLLQKDWCAFSYKLLWEFDPTSKVPVEDGLAIQEQVITQNYDFAVKGSIVASTLSEEENISEFVEESIDASQKKGACSVVTSGYNDSAEVIIVANIVKESPTSILAVTDIESQGYFCWEPGPIHSCSRTLMWGYNTKMENQLVVSRSIVDSLVASDSDNSLLDEYKLLSAESLPRSPIVVVFCINKLCPTSRDSEIVWYSLMVCPARIRTQYKYSQYAEIRVLKNDCLSRPMSMCAVRDQYKPIQDLVDVCLYGIAHKASAFQPCLSYVNYRPNLSQVFMMRRCFLAPMNMYFYKCRDQLATIITNFSILGIVLFDLGINGQLILFDKVLVIVGSEFLEGDGRLLSAGGTLVNQLVARGRLIVQLVHNDTSATQDAPFTSTPAYIPVVSLFTILHGVYNAMMTLCTRKYKGEHGLQSIFSCELSLARGDTLIFFLWQIAWLLNHHCSATLLVSAILSGVTFIHLAEPNTYMCEFCLSSGQGMISYLMVIWCFDPGILVIDPLLEAMTITFKLANVMRLVTAVVAGVCYLYLSLLIHLFNSRQEIESTTYIFSSRFTTIRGNAQSISSVVHIKF